MLKVNEIYKCILGESTFAGLPCALVRLTGCNLRCSYCDTTYAYENGVDMSVDQIVRRIRKFGVAPVLITGGEPLLQDEVFQLMERLFQLGHMVLIETNGSIDLKNVTEDAIIIMDVKCPGSGAGKSTILENLDLLSEPDNVKFVITGRKDYLWARDVIYEYELSMFCPVLMSPAHGLIDPRELSEWMVEDNLYARLSLQMHKIIWGDDVRGK